MIGESDKNNNFLWYFSNNEKNVRVLNFSHYFANISFYSSALSLKIDCH